ncbi:hypothetical protein F3J20_30190 [Paraburkholderia sp. Cy-641]|uniref:hypothetical protein n=1 Tax=Paraburkholderia sp. Cy-641 TaxID=2608337 RepID=UPI00141F5626|nr:hypothetical protein [Paraburkholderia sp. Cy-641]NIF81592.1 hypothetical protein [Paraburkholderia sp. Cy-641]
MANDLSPICKALIQIFARVAVVRTIDDIERMLPDADHKALRADLQTLVQAEVVRQALRYADERLVYWLAGASIESFVGTVFHYPPQQKTLADVAGIAHAREVIHG